MRTIEVDVYLARQDWRFAIWTDVFARQDDFTKLSRAASLTSSLGCKTLYVAGDTLWNEMVEDAIAKHEPEVIVLNAGKATIIGLDPIIMGEDDVLAVHRAAPKATLIASHMEAVNRCILSRADLRAFSKAEGFSSSLLLPADSESIAV